MFPDLALSSVPLQGDFVEKVNARRAPLIDYEWVASRQATRVQACWFAYGPSNQGRRCGPERRRGCTGCPVQPARHD